MERNAVAYSSTLAMSEHIKLYIPGPIEVSPDTLQALTQPMIGHRSGDYQKLHASVQPALQELFGTQRKVYLSTSSAWGVMEGAIRNLVGKKVLNCCCGAFSDKWYDVSLRCGKEAEELKVEWGEAIIAELIDERLSSGEFDAVTLVHSETSTGVLNPLAEIAALKSKYPEVMFIVDTVSSFTTMTMEFDNWGLDLILTGTQKALALPPGLALFVASQAALDKAATIDGRGYYFDLLEFEKNAEKDMTPSTPSISLIYGLRHKLQQIQEEGLENRFARHQKLNSMVADWVVENGFEFFAPEGYRSTGLTCISNNRGIDVAELNNHLKENASLMINGGYGKIKGSTFRISNMGDESEESMQVVLDAMDAALEAQSTAA